MLKKSVTITLPNQLMVFLDFFLAREEFFHFALALLLPFLAFFSSCLALFT